MSYKTIIANPAKKKTAKKKTVRSRGQESIFRARGAGRTGSFDYTPPRFAVDPLPLNAGERIGIGGTDSDRKLLREISGTHVEDSLFEFLEGEPTEYDIEILKERRLIEPGGEAVNDNGWVLYSLLSDTRRAPAKKKTAKKKTAKKKTAKKKTAKKKTAKKKTAKKKTAKPTDTPRLPGRLNADISRIIRDMRAESLEALELGSGRFRSRAAKAARRAYDQHGGDMYALENEAIRRIDAARRALINVKAAEKSFDRVEALRLLREGPEKMDRTKLLGSRRNASRLRQYELDEIKTLGPVMITERGGENVYFVLADGSRGFVKVPEGRRMPRNAKTVPRSALAEALGPPEKKTAKKKTAKKKTAKKKTAKKKTAKKKTAKKKTAKKKTAKKKTAKKKTAKKKTAKKKTAKKKTAKKKTAKRKTAKKTTKRTTSGAGKKPTAKQLSSHAREISKFAGSLSEYLRKVKRLSKADADRVKADLRDALKSEAACKVASGRYETDPRRCNVKDPRLKKYKGARGPKLMGEYSTKTGWKKAPSLTNKKFWGD